MQNVHGAYETLAELVFHRFCEDRGLLHTLDRFWKVSELHIREVRASEGWKIQISRKFVHSITF